METFAVLGGDLRFAYLAGLLAEDGYKVITAGLDNTDLPSCVTGCTHIAAAAAPADYIILPFPVTGDGKNLNAPFARNPIPLEEILSALRPGQRVFGGMLDERISAALTERRTLFYDYALREELTLRNAIPTAEGAVQIALEELPITLHDCPCLVTGYGRCAQQLARLLAAMGARVTVAARKYSDRALAEMSGYGAVHTRDIADAGSFEVYFNTVPARLFDEALLTCLPRKALLIDIASRPGGVDMAAAATLGIKCIWALALPGRVAPKTAASILQKTILAILTEQEEAP